MLPDSSDIGRQQRFIATQLVRVMERVQHIDELLLWVTQMMVHHLDIRLIQLWAPDVTSASSSRSLTVRTMASSDATLPPHVVTGPHVVSLTGQIFLQEREVLSQRIEDTFSPYHTMLFKRYGLHYWTGGLLLDPTILLPASFDAPTGASAVFVKLPVMIFTQHEPSESLLPSVILLFQQTFALAKRLS